MTGAGIDPGERRPVVNAFGHALGERDGDAGHRRHRPAVRNGDLAIDLLGDRMPAGFTPIGPCFGHLAMPYIELSSNQ